MNKDASTAQILNAMVSSIGRFLKEQPNQEILLEASSVYVYIHSIASVYKPAKDFHTIGQRSHQFQTTCNREDEFKRAGECRRKSSIHWMSLPHK